MPDRALATVMSAVASDGDLTTQGQSPTPALTAGELKGERALEVFNAGEPPRRVAGVTRSLGEPSVAARPRVAICARVSPPALASHVATAMRARVTRELVENPEQGVSQGASPADRDRQRQLQIGLFLRETLPGVLDTIEERLTAIERHLGITPSADPDAPPGAEPDRPRDPPAAG